MQFAKRLFVEEQGQTMAEYGLLIALIALIAMAGASLLGGNLLTTFNSIAGAV